MSFVAAGGGGSGSDDWREKELNVRERGRSLLRNNLFININVSVK